VGVERLQHRLRGVSGSGGTRGGFARAPAVFVLGLEIFTLASLLCAVAPSGGLLVCFRVLQAVGAALIVPSSLAPVLNAFPPSAARTA